MDLDGSARRFYEKVYQEGSYGRDVQEEHVEPLRALLGQVPESGFVLELGPGRGALQGLHPGYVATDLSVQALAHHLHAPTFASDIQRLPLRTGIVDFLYTVAVLEHVPRPELALQEIARVLAPGGCAYLAPAWNCRTWAAEGLNVRPYGDLTFTQKVRKMTIPLRDSLLWRGLFAIPKRMARRGGPGIRCFVAWASSPQFLIQGLEAPATFRAAMPPSPAMPTSLPSPQRASPPLN